MMKMMIFQHLWQSLSFLKGFWSLQRRRAQLQQLRLILVVHQFDDDEIVVVEFVDDDFVVVVVVDHLLMKKKPNLKTKNPMRKKMFVDCFVGSKMILLESWMMMMEHFLAVSKIQHEDVDSSLMLSEMV